MGNCYGDIPLGLFLIRGDNVVLLGEIVFIFQKIFFLKILIFQLQFFKKSPEKENNLGIREVSMEEIFRLYGGSSNNKDQKDELIRNIRKDNALPED